MPLTGRYTAVVFDMDGLLLDTEVLWERAESELARRHGVEWTFDDKLAVMGTSADHTARYFSERFGEPPDRGPALLAELYELMTAELELQVDARPGAVELVRRLRDLGGVAIGLASNSTRAMVDVALRSAGLSDAFDAIVSADDVEHPKPAPDIYLLACERLGVMPADALALEDTPSGIAAAKAAGLTCIAVPQFAETEVSAADRVVDSLKRLLDGG